MKKNQNTSTTRTSPLYELIAKNPLICG